MTLLSTRLKRLAPGVVWVGAALTALWLYTLEASEGQSLAYSEVVEVDVSAAVSGRIARTTLEVGQVVTSSVVVVTLDAADLDAQVRIAAENVERIEARIALVEKQRQNAAKKNEICTAD